MGERPLRSLGASEAPVDGQEPRALTAGAAGKAPAGRVCSPVHSAGLPGTHGAQGRQRGRLLLSTAEP